MPVQIFGAAVHHQIEAVLERAIVDGRGKRVVDQRYQPMRFGELHDALEIGHTHQRIRDGFDIDRARGRVQQRRPRLGPIGVDEVNGNAELLQLSRQKVVRAAIENVLREQMVAGSEHCEQRGRDCRHPAGCHNRGFGAFQGGELSLDRCLRGRVVEADVLEVVITAFAGIFEHRRLEERHDDRPAWTRRWHSGVDGFGFQMFEGSGHGRARGDCIHLSQT